MLLSKNKKVLIQGITGKESRYWVEKMSDYGTDIQAGVAPGKGGQSVVGIPVYDSVKEAVKQHALNTSLLFVAPSLVETAAMEAIDGGIKEIIILADGVPVHNTMRLLSYGSKNGVRIIGPNTPGLVYPGFSSIGIMPAWLSHVFKPGEIGIVSRSGSLGNEASYQVVQAGFGISHFIGIGGDLLVGTTTVEVLEEFEKNDDIKGVVLVGELGGNMEEQAAGFIRTMHKPVVALIAGKASPIGVSMGHAGAIVEGTEGSVESKQKILAENGAYIANTPFEIGALLKSHIT
ncbi:MAG: hypothetical protein SCL54_10730 [Bacillota bacterium]|nr:hypothetical protein [Bacillota bacterium]